MPDSQKSNVEKLPQPFTLFDSYQKKEVQLGLLDTVEKGAIKIYSCGPTVYNYQTIGNMRAVWMGDTISKVANIAGYKSQWVSNITDVGHLVDDGDDGKNVTNSQDKLEKGAKREGKNVRDIVDFYTQDFKEQCAALNLNLPSGKMNPKATEYIPEQMVLALKLLQENKAYILEDGIYFNSKYKDSGSNSEQANSEKNIAKIISRIKYLQLQNPNKPLIIAIDGLAGSGKTVFSKKLALALGGVEIVKFDKFQFEKDLVNKLKSENKSFKINFKENYNFQKIHEEVIKPFQTQDSGVLIIEGCYSFLIDHDFDLRIWLDLPLATAKTRVIARETEEADGWSEADAKNFYTEWEKFEKENYIDTFNPKEKADIVVSTEKEEYKIIKNIDQKNYTGREIVNTTKDPEDFALWKFVESNALQKWKFSDFPVALDLVESIYSLDQNQSLDKDSLLDQWGCPGWHSECVAMISEILGEHRFSAQNFASDIDSYEIDIHTGGEDHIDIHHKNERLQSHALGIKLSKLWVHNKFVLVDSKKMSKSLGNVYLVQGKFADTGFYSFETPPIHEFSNELKQQILKKYKELKSPLTSDTEEAFWDSFSFDPLAYKLMMFEHHFTQQMNFTWDKLWDSQSRLWNIRRAAAKIHSFAITHAINSTIEYKQIEILLKPLLSNLEVPKFLEKFQGFLDDVVGEIVSKGILDTRNLGALEYWENNFLKLNLLPKLPKDILELADLRDQAKVNKDYTLSDNFRDQISSNGFQVDDHSWGYGLWKR